MRVALTRGGRTSRPSSLPPRAAALDGCTGFRYCESKWSAVPPEGGTPSRVGSKAASKGLRGVCRRRRSALVAAVRRPRTTSTHDVTPLLDARWPADWVLAPPAARSSCLCASLARGAVHGPRAAGASLPAGRGSAFRRHAQHSVMRSWSDVIQQLCGFQRHETPHNHKPSRKARSRSVARYRARAGFGSATFCKAAAFMARSAST